MRSASQKSGRMEASTSSQKLVKALDYYVVIVTGWKHHYYTGSLVYFVVWRCGAAAGVRAGASRTYTLQPHFIHHPITV